METTVSAHVIYYCEKCNKRIAEADVGKSKMLPDNRALCGGCAAGASAPAPAPRRSSERVTPDRGSRSTIPAAQPSRQTARGRVAPAPARPFPTLIVAGIGLLMVAVVAIALLLGNSTGPSSTPHTRTVPEPKKVVQTAAPVTTPPPRTSATSVQPAAPITTQPSVTPSSPTAPTTDSTGKRDAYDPRSETAHSLLVQAKGYRTANGSDLFGYREKLEYICTNFSGTKASVEAKALMENDAKLPELPDGRNPQPPAADAWAGAIQILPAVDPGKDRVKGWWKLEDGKLRSDKAMWAMLGLPYTPPEEYNVRVTFERTENDDCLLVFLSRRGKPFIFSIGSGNKNCSFETVRESQADILPTKTVKPNLFPNRQRTEVVILVRSQCLRAYLNGKPIVGCQVDDEGLSLNASLKLLKEGQLGLATWNSVYTFESIEVLPVTGDGSLLRSGGGL